MKNGIRLIGLFALMLGVLFSYRTISAAIYSPMSLSIHDIWNIILWWLAIYGGYQTINLRLIGHKLLLVFFSYQVILTATFIVGVFWAIAVGNLNNLWVEPTWRQSFIKATSYSLFCILSLTLFYRKNISVNFQPENNYQHMEIMGKILSVVAPGLGRALVSNKWAGIFLFFICSFLFEGLHIYFTDFEIDIPLIYINWGGWAFLGLIFDLFTKILIWMFFFRIDWVFVKNAAETQARISQSLNLAPSAESDQ